MGHQNLVGIGDQAKRRRSGIPDGDDHVLLRPLADHFSGNIPITNGFRQDQRRGVTVHMKDIGLLRRHHGKIPADDLRRGEAQGICPTPHVGYGVRFRFRADHGIADVTERRYLPDADVGIGLLIDADILPHQLIHGAAKQIAQFQQLIHFRIGHVQLPLGNRLPAHIQFFGQCFLGHPVAHSS